MPKGEFTKEPSQMTDYELKDEILRFMSSFDDSDLPVYRQQIDDHFESPPFSEDRLIVCLKELHNAKHIHMDTFGTLDYEPLNKYTVYVTHLGRTFTGNYTKQHIEDVAQKKKAANMELLKSIWTPVFVGILTAIIPLACAFYTESERSKLEKALNKQDSVITRLKTRIKSDSLRFSQQGRTIKLDSNGRERNH